MARIIDRTQNDNTRAGRFTVSEERDQPAQAAPAPRSKASIGELASVLRVIEAVLPGLMKTGLSSHADRILEVLLDILPMVADEMTKLSNKEE